jgi:Leucine-rich repeat (LRR) protein
MDADGNRCVTIRDVWDWVSLPEVLFAPTILPQALFDLAVLSGLTKLYIHNTNIREFPPSILMLTSLTMLDVSQNPVLEAVTEHIGQMVGLKVLNLGGTRLQELPSSIGKLTGLEILDLEGCGLLEPLPTEIGSMVGLRTLNLSECDLKEVPSCIGNLTGLQTLFLGGCHLDLVDEMPLLPEEIGEMEGLRHISILITDAKDPRLPSSIGKLTGLEKLSIEGHPMSLVPNLNFKHPHIAAALLLPEEIGEMEGLREIIIEYAGAKALPSSIVKLTGLEKLSIRGCSNIEALPQEIRRMVGRHGGRSATRCWLISNECLLDAPGPKTASTKLLRNKNPQSCAPCSRRVFELDSSLNSRGGGDMP